MGGPIANKIGRWDRFQCSFTFSNLRWGNVEPLNWNAGCRKNGLLFNLSLNVIGAVFFGTCTMAQSVEMLLIGRFIVGFASGCFLDYMQNGKRNTCVLFDQECPPVSCRCTCPKWPPNGQPVSWASSARSASSPASSSARFSAWKSFSVLSIVDKTESWYPRRWIINVRLETKSIVNNIRKAVLNLYNISPSFTPIWNPFFDRF